MVRRAGNRRLLIGAIVLFAVSLLLLDPAGRLRDGPGVSAVLVCCLVAGLGSGLFQVPVANTLLSDLPAEVRGRGVGLLNALMVNFMIIGVVLGGVAADLAGIGRSLVLTGAVLLPVALLLAVSPLARHPDGVGEKRVVENAGSG
ncbi:MFS transporter [Streptomyces laurentii]|uniref:MFS transporter n=1 Tax=Streptomyces laurentii TaxID=39478 RepID=UPI0036B836DF